MAAIKFDAAGAIQSYLQYPLASLSALYVKVEDVTISAAVLAVWYGIDPSFTGDLMDIDDTVGTRDGVYLTDNTSPTEYDAWGAYLEGSSIVLPPIADVQHTIEMWHPAAGSGYFKVDGTSQAGSPFTPTGGWQDLRIGYCDSWISGFGPPPSGSFTCGKITIGTTDGGSDVLVFDPATAPDLSPFSLAGNVTLEGAPPPPATVGYRSPFWRFVILDYLTFEILSFLDRLASERTATYTLNQPAVSEGVVPSDNPEINLPWPDPDSDPFLNEGTRVLYGFRREGTLDDPPVWVPRFAGIIMQLEDTAASDNAFSHYTAYDPWQYLFSRPVCNSDGSLPGVDGISFSATQAQVIAGTLLANTIANMGDVGIDAGLTYGGTGLFTGTINICEAIDINFPQGTTVGQAWKTLCDMDVCDIILEPIYDPADRPGYLVQFNIYTQAGVPRDDAIFAWDMPSRSLVGIRRLIEGGLQRANEVKYFAGPGGSATGGEIIPVQADAVSVAKYREYWRQTFFPGQNVAGAVEALAQAQLALSKDGRVTVAISPAPERSPIPWEEYWLGDRVPVYASQRFRAPIPSAATSGSDVVTNYQRVYGVPLIIADDATEQIDQLLTALPGTGA
jgi:hypothetical protein